MIFLLSAQTPENRPQYHNKLFDHLTKNGAADISLRMLERPLFSRKDKAKNDELEATVKALTSELNEIKEILKNLTPTKSE